MGKSFRLAQKSGIILPVKPKPHIVPPASCAAYRKVGGRTGLHNLAGGATIFIYRAVFPNGKCYVGQTRKLPKYRWAEHISAAKKGRNKNLPFARALLKYGDSVKWEVIAEVPAMWANEEEKRLIAENNALVPNGYNLREGGNVAPVSAATRAKISAGMMGEKNPMFGKHYTAEERAEMGAKIRAAKAKIPTKGKGLEFPSQRNTAPKYPKPCGRITPE